MKSELQILELAYHGFDQVNVVLSDLDMRSEGDPKNGFHLNDL